MKALLSIILVLMVCIISGGCPYETDVPIDNPSVKINSKLLGKWKDSQTEDASYKVSKKDDFTYSIEKSQKDSDDKEKYLAYASVINGTTFLNIWEDKGFEEKHSYSLYKMEVKSEKQITLTEVTENIDEKFISSDELKKFITANMKNSYFFSKDETILLR